MSTGQVPDREATLRELPTEDGVLRYHEVGDGEPLLLLHGSGPGVTGWRNYRQNLPALAEHFRCLVLEFPGFGVSHDTDQSPFVSGLSAITRFVESLDLRGVPVVGNSMGGVLALQSAIADPALFSRIVTVGGVGTGIFSPSPGEGIVRLTDFSENPTREALVQWLESMVHDPAMVTEELIAERWEQATAPATLEASLRMYGRAATAARKRSAATSDRAPYWAMLHRVTVPTLLTWGRDDRVSPLDMSLVPMRTIPNAELHVLPRCGHWAMIEQQAAWESAVLAFLRRTARSAEPATDSAAEGLARTGVLR
ncbi:alpha/beta fold hydrolase [Nocardioides sambongensis]|uniref:alpha/beta fold hydrolase n=1 Tax=Nocardioides sambongensis TaxID=2589074 RepID=UPI0011289F80|nr:alpha/beta fold hydrolase [Nocardioides sambongensis]